MTPVQGILELHTRGHGFLRNQSGQDGANLKAVQRAWPKTVAFLKQYTEGMANKSQD